jgi:thiosulfate/3-mercaptopyruvate sulfurtransferase
MARGLRCHPPAQAAAPTLVTSPESLLAILSTTPSAPAPILLDARPEADFSRARLPGARSAAAQAWDKLARSGNPLEDRAAWAARLGALGLDGSTPIIIYDAGGMTDAARVWFILQNAGAINVTILDGGLKVFQTLPGADRFINTSTAIPSHTATTFVPAPLTQAAAAPMNKGSLRSLDRSRNQILDARTPDEFTGTDARGNARAGRVPGSVSIPHTDLIASSGRLKSGPELRSLFIAAGLDPSKPIVTYCQSGGRASLAALAAIEAGFGPVSNYYNSFGEWAADMTCPVE